MATMVNRFALWALCALLFACSETAELPKLTPEVVTRDDVGYFCGMIVEDHLGPKSQAFVANQAEVIWFTSVRDGVAFSLLPEERARLRVFYVTAMDLAPWDHPEQVETAWIEAADAWYVLGSEKRGGMGAPEAIPFSTRQAAQDFAAAHGGEVAAFTAIPEAYILGHGQQARLP